MRRDHPAVVGELERLASVADARDAAVASAAAAGDDATPYLEEVAKRARAAADREAKAAERKQRAREDVERISGVRQTSVEL